MGSVSQPKVAVWKIVQGNRRGAEAAEDAEGWSWSALMFPALITGSRPTPSRPPLQSQRPLRLCGCLGMRCLRRVFGGGNLGLGDELTMDVGVQPVGGE